MLASKVREGISGQYTLQEKMSSFDPFCLLQFHTFPHHWTVSLAKHSPMIFTNVLENLITFWNVKQAVGLHYI